MKIEQQNLYLESYCCRKKTFLACLTPDKLQLISEKWWYSNNTLASDLFKADNSHMHTCNVESWEGLRRSRIELQILQRFAAQKYTPVKVDT